jgi:glycosyltransferase involved in cell wall biosynthesis
MNPAPLRIAYVGSFSTPPSDAASARVYGIGRALRQAGHKVIFIGREQGAAPGHHDGFEFHPRARRGRAWSLASEVMGGDYLARLRSLARPPDLVIFYGGFIPMALRLLRHCRSRGIAVAADVVECYDPSHVPMGSIGPFRWNADLTFAWFTPKLGHVICISRWLNQYYQSRGCRTVQVPPMLDVAAVPFLPVSGSPGMRLGYAGSPGRKDWLGNVLAGLADLRREGIPASIRLVGVSPAAAAESLAWCGQPPMDLADVAEFTPKVTADKVPALLSECDFLPLLRPPQRYAQAGFPTKLTEAMACGLPVIANLTSNLDDYLVEGSNAFLARDHGKAAFVEAARRAWAARDRWPAMRQAARATAAAGFDYRVHAAALDTFVRAAATPSP